MQLPYEIRTLFSTYPWCLKSQIRMFCVEASRSLCMGFCQQLLVWLLALSICRDPGVEERPNGITVHSLPPTGRWGGFNSNTTTHDLLYQKVVAVHGLLGLSRLSNRKGVKAILPFETNTMSLEESPAFPSTTEHRSPQERDQVPTAKGQNGVP